MCPTTNTDLSPVQEVLALLEGRLRTLSVYSPEHPIHEQEVEKIREGFSGLWGRLSGLPRELSFATHVGPPGHLGHSGKHHT